MRSSISNFNSMTKSENWQQGFNTNSVNRKTILFLSALDFKEKGIDVIKRTPEFYAKNGWNVEYVVARDNSKTGNYFYEREINPEGVNVHRFYKPLTLLQDSVKNHTIKTIISKIANFIVIFRLAYIGGKICKSKKIDVVYGYEIHGVLAVNLLKFLGFLKNVKTISRFQGTFYSYYYYRMFLKMFLNFEHYLALYLPSDLCIMTNDGTQGDKLLAAIKSKNLKNFKFWINGVDEQKLPEDDIKQLKKQLNVDSCEVIFVTICRLELWKRVDRGIRAVAVLRNKFGVDNFKYFVVGDGSQKEQLKKLVYQLGLENNVIFTGAVNNKDVKIYLNIADIFISTYDVSNVGNPLLEAIRANKIIFTLNNGDTAQWITHRVNGFIYDVEDDDKLAFKMASDIFNLLRDNSLKNLIIDNIKKTEKEKLWTWNERLNAEIREVEKLLQ